MKKILLISAILGWCFLSQLHAQTSDSLTTSSAPAFDVQTATAHYLNMLSPEAKAKSDAYFEGGYLLILVDLLYAIGVAFVFLALGLSKWIKKIATKVSNVNLQNLIYVILYTILAWLLSFPLSVYEGYYREHQYNLSNLTFGGWLTENLQGFGLSLVFLPLMIMLLYIALRRTGKNWWLWGAGGTLAFMMFFAFIAPVFISPIFNQYKPLEEGPLKSEILAMARANSIPAENVYQFDASKQSNRVSANVSGFASTTRISLNDNLLKRCTPAEIKAVMGHEMGHYVMNHVYKGMLAFGVLIFIVFALVNWSLNKIILKKGSDWGIESMSDIAGLPLLFVIISVVMFFATPVTNTLVRTQEMEADIFGLNAAREPDAEAHVDIMLSEYRKLNPSKWEEIFFFDHPSGRVRVETAMKWKAEHLGDKK